MARLAFLCGCVLASSLAHADPITYQGRLTDSGAAVNGVYDFVFRLYDDAAAGSQVGVQLSKENVDVDSGVFTVELDFGNTAFDAPRWLDIRVRPDGGVFTTLNPRQPLNPSPYSIEHLNEPWAPTPTGVAFGNGSQRAFINRTLPVTNAEWFGFTAPTTPNGYGGMYINTTDTTGWPFYGYIAGGVNAMWTYFNPSANEWIVNNGGTAFKVNNAGDTTASGSSTAESFRYETPKTHYYSVPGDAATCASGDPFRASGGSGGAYLTAASDGWLTVPVNLPHGAVVQNVKFWFIDNAVGDMTLYLERRPHAVGTFAPMASVSSSGQSTVIQASTDVSIGSPTIDNIANSYHLRVYSSGWPGTADMRFIAAVIEYTTAEAD